MQKQIIVIDDDPDDIEIMKESIQTLGHEYECKSFIDACEALEYLRYNTSIPTLIIIDINMPKMNGQECLHEIRKIAKLYPSLVAVYSSAVATKEDLANFEKFEAIFFQKPSTYDALNKIFSQLIDASLQRSEQGDLKRKGLT